MSLRVTAIIAARNEGDILGQVIDDLIRQHVDVYLIDDGSTDDTLATAESRLHRGVVGVERRPPSDSFDWEGLLQRKATLASELDADWFIHHDADEFRESPWAHLDLRAAIAEVDSLGYTAIDFRVLNFRPTAVDMAETHDIRAALTRYEPAGRWDRVQVKCWRRSESSVDLVTSGGHDVAFPSRVVFPTRFLVRHYPIRGREHGHRKVHQERLPRFRPEERSRGWHVQYDALATAAELVWPIDTLVPFDADRVRHELLAESRDAAAALDLSARLHEVHQTLSRERAELAARTETMAALQRDLGRTAEDYRLLDDERRRLESVVARLVSDATHLQSELEAVYRSASWTITAPIRALSQSVHRGATEKDSAPVVTPPVGRPAEPAAAPDGLVELPPDAPRRHDQAAICWGDLDRRRPISTTWGLDRGRPVDRHFIEAFLASTTADIRGRVLEVKDATYARRFGEAIDRVDVVDIDPVNPQVTIVADLTQPSALPPGAFDCFILTQTLHIIFDVRAAIGGAFATLRPGGVLLCTIPAVSRVNPENGGLESGDYWRMTRAGVDRLFAAEPLCGHFAITTVGNVKTCAAFLYGLAAEDLDAADLAFHDPWFPLLHCVRAIRR